MLGSLYLLGVMAQRRPREFGRARDLGAAKADWMPGYARALMLQGQLQVLLDEVQGRRHARCCAACRAAGPAWKRAPGLRQVEDAVAAYDAALVLQSGNPMARLGKAQILLSEKPGGKRRSLRSTSAGRQSQACWKACWRAVICCVACSASTGRQRLCARRRGIANNPRAHVGSALVHIAQRDVAAAKRDLAVLNRITRDLPAVNYLQALVSFQEKDLDRASDELQVLLRAARLTCRHSCCTASLWAQPVHDRG